VESEYDIRKIRSQNGAGLRVEFVGVGVESESGIRVPTHPWSIYGPSLIYKQWKQFKKRNLICAVGVQLARSIVNGLVH